MFQFAFGLAASARLETDFAMDDVLLRRVFTLDPWSRPLRRLRRATRYRAARRTAPFPVVKVDNNSQLEPRDVLAGVEDRTHYAGFFQSELFFAEATAAVRRAFTPRREHAGALAERYAELVATPYVACHVRRTDYVAHGVALPASYYRDCLDRLGVGDERTVVVVGDDVDWLRSELGERRNYRYESNDEAVDLLLVAHAGDVVVSNSSFAWWGAWLNERRPRVLAPRYWLGLNERRELPLRAIPDRWEQVEVEPSLSDAPR